MIKAILAAAGFVFIFSHSAYSQEVDCGNQDGSSQLELNHCSWEAYQEADKQLNQVWTEVRRYTDDLDSTNSNDGHNSTASDDLLNAQRAWIKYRDGHCQVKAAKYEGGSAQPQILNSCKEELTIVRTQQFLTLMHEN